MIIREALAILDQCQFKVRFNSGKAVRFNSYKDGDVMRRKMDCV